MQKKSLINQNTVMITSSKMGIVELIQHRFSSVSLLCLTLCDLMDCSRPGFPVLYHLPELAQNSRKQSPRTEKHKEDKWKGWGKIPEYSPKIGYQLLIAEWWAITKCTWFKKQCTCCKKIMFPSSKSYKQQMLERMCRKGTFLHCWWEWRWM